MQWAQYIWKACTLGGCFQAWGRLGKSSDRWHFWLLTQGTALQSQHEELSCRYVHVLSYPSPLLYLFFHNFDDKAQSGGLDITLKNCAVKPGVLFTTPDQRHHCSTQSYKGKTTFSLFLLSCKVPEDNHKTLGLNSPFLRLVDQLTTNRGLEKWLHDCIFISFLKHYRFCVSFSR